MSIYDDLGVDPLINAATTFTAIGGSLMPPEVLTAMTEAAASFVDMNELHLAAGTRLAEVTRNDAAYVTSGCAAAMILAILGIRTKGLPGAITEFPGRDQTPSEIIMHAAHRIPYDATLAMSGVTIRQIGNVVQTFPWELDAAITDRTAAVLYVAGPHLPGSALALSEVVEIAHARGVPVLVDAAAQLPPVENLWRFTRDTGADLVAFSGGKALRGPQASGMLLGREDLVEFARQNGAPFQRWGRALKAGKEEIAGLVRAVERFVALDHDALRAEWSSVLETWRDRFTDLPGIRLAIDPLNEAGQPVPRLHIAIPNPQRAEAVLAALHGGRPRIEVLPDRHNGTALGLWLGADMLSPGEADVVADAISSALLTHRGPS
jgi:uncharacterized pyridoxal phosphate-dependent enzyme